MRFLAILLATLAVVAPARGSGILAPTDQTLPPLRITDHLVDVEIHDGIALTTVTQTFRNDTGRRLEATYVFPLPDEGDLTDFRMTFNGKMVQGKVLPAEEAVKIYESIVRQMKDPGLIEFIGRRLLQMRVFPIEPGSETTIQVRYQQVCRPIGGMVGYHYPLRTRKTAGQAYGTVRFAVELSTSAPLKNIWSPSHAVEIVRPSETEARIGYEANGGSLEDDFLLLYHTESSDVGLSAIAHKPKSDAPGHFVVMVTPKQLWPEDSYEPQDVVFVADTSGSMAGDKLEQAKAALRYSIEQLDERDRFSVVRFSTGFDVLFESPKSATKENKGKARTFVDGFRSAGGTNIADTLERVVEMARDAAADDADRPFVVVFMTDGRGNRKPEEILARLTQAGDDIALRVFPFGVGHDVNTVLLDRLAERYSGRTSYVQPGENLELILGDFFAIVSRPVLTNVRLTLPEIEATDRFPARVGDLYHGQQLILAGQFAREARGPVKLTAMRGGERIEYVWPDVAFTSTDGATYVPSVWAGRKIAALIDQVRVAGETTELIAEIVALSQLYGIQTPYTSWLVDPERQAQLAGVPVTRFESLGVDGPARGRGGGFGGGGSFGRRAPAARALDSAGAPASEMNLERGYANLNFGDDFDEITAAEAGEAVTETSGRLGNLIARKNAELRELGTRDAGRLDRSQLPVQRIGDRWYQRIGHYLVDESVDEKTEITIIKFGSAAYFELARRRADLRPALAASKTIGVIVAPDKAILISEVAGAEELTEAQRSTLLKADS